MWSVLKLIMPHAFYGVIIAALVAFGVYEREHLIGEGEKKIEAKDVALRKAAAALNTAAEQLADIKEIPIGRTYEKTILVPVPAAPGLVCHNSAPAKQPEAAASGPKVDAPADVLPGGSFNPSGGLLTLLRNADAQVIGLQDTVRNLNGELAGNTQ